MLPWVGLVLAGGLAWLQIVPKWNVFIEMLILLLWLLFVLWQLRVFFKLLSKRKNPATFADAPPSRSFPKFVGKHNREEVGWSAILFGTMLLLYCAVPSKIDFYGSQLVETIHTPTASIYIYESLNFRENQSLFTLKAQYYPFPVMYTVLQWMALKPELIDSVLGVRDIPIYNLRTHEQLFENE